MSFYSRSILIAVLSVLALFSFQVAAQRSAETFTARNSVFLEVGGNAGQYAFNYGRMIHQKGILKIVASAGFALWADPIAGSTIWMPVVPLEVSTLIGKRRHHLELGLGITSYLEAEVNSSWESGTLVQTKGASHLDAVLPFRIGYRYQKPEGGFFFRLGYTPFLAMPNKSREYWVFQPLFAGVGIGKSF